MINNEKYIFNATDFYILDLLFDNSKSNITFFSKKIGSEHGYTSIRIKILSEKGLILNKIVGRQKVLELSSKGKELVLVLRDVVKLYNGSI